MSKFQRTTRADIHTRGVVETARFIYLVKSEAFDYTKWSREHYDAISLDKFDAALDQFSAKNEFKGSKARII